MKLDNIFRSSRDSIEFVNPRLSRQFVRTIATRALAHPADYQALPADLQSDIALLALQAGMSLTARQLRAASTDQAQSLCDAWGFRGADQISPPEAASQQIPAAPQGSSHRGSRRSWRAPVRSWLRGLRDRFSLALLRALYRDDMTGAQAVRVITYRAAGNRSDDLVTQVMPGYRIDPDWIFQTGRITHTGQQLVS